LTLLRRVRKASRAGLQFRQARSDNIRWARQDFILENVDRVDPTSLVQTPHLQQRTHQVSRYNQMVEIARQVRSQGVTGDVLEFGTWQGTGLLLLGKAFAGSGARTLLGVDSFEGLP